MWSDQPSPVSLRSQGNAAKLVHTPLTDKCYCCGKKPQLNTLPKTRGREGLELNAKRLLLLSQEQQQCRSCVWPGSVVIRFRFARRGPAGPSALRGPGEPWLVPGPSGGSSDSRVCVSSLLPVRWFYMHCGHAPDTLGQSYWGLIPFIYINVPPTMARSSQIILQS